MNLPPEDKLRKEDKSSAAPKVSFTRRFHCIAYSCYKGAYYASIILTKKRAYCAQNYASI